jgi:hypothetical protein
VLRDERRLQMPRTLTRAAIALTASFVLAASFATAAYARAGDPRYTRDQVGYSVTGASFQSADEHFKLPRVARFAPEVGWVGVSVQLWSPHVMAELTAYTCTDKSCRPGGKAVNEKYRLSFSLYNPGTHVLICSTRAAVARLRCTTPSLAAWNRTRLAAGSQAELDLYFNQQADALMADVGGSHDLFRGVVVFPDVRRFNQARIALQFAASPFAAAGFRRPARKELMLTVGGWPYMADFSLPSSRGGYIGSALWTHHQVVMTTTGSVSGRSEIAPGGLVHDGTTFGIYLLR